MNKLLVVIIAILTITSCSKYDTLSNESFRELNFNFGIQTKVTGNEFQNGDEVTLYAVEYTSENAPELQIAGNYLNNEKIIYDGTNWKGTRKLYWSEKPCDFYAIYPYVDLTSIDEHLFEITDNQDIDNGLGYEYSDILWAKATNISRPDNNDGLEMHFKHLMSKCSVTIVPGPEFDGQIPDDIVCHIYNTTTSAKLNITKGTVEKESMGDRKTITMKKLSNDPEAKDILGKFEAIVVPQRIERNTPLIEITMGGIAYLVEHSITFKPGYNHKFIITINKSPMQEKIEISIDPDAGNWE